MKKFNQIRITVVVILLMGVWLSYDVPKEINIYSDSYANKVVGEHNGISITQLIIDLPINDIGC